MERDTDADRAPSRFSLQPATRSWAARAAPNARMQASRRLAEDPVADDERQAQALV